MGIEPMTSTLARLRSTTKLRPRSYLAQLNLKHWYGNITEKYCILQLREKI